MTLHYTSPSHIHFQSSFFLPSVKDHLRRQALLLLETSTGNISCLLNPDGSTEEPLFPTILLNLPPCRHPDNRHSGSQPRLTLLLWSTKSTSALWRPFRRALLCTERNKTYIQTQSCLCQHLKHLQNTQFMYQRGTVLWVSFSTASTHTDLLKEPQIWGHLWGCGSWFWCCQTAGQWGQHPAVKRRWAAIGTEAYNPEIMLWHVWLRDFYELCHEMRG